jgi:chromosome partitioning protein
MPIIAIAGQKGGTGKSTIAICLASELLARGLRVLLVDADPQRSAATWRAVAQEYQRASPTLLILGAQMHTSGQLDAVAGAYDITIIDCPPAHSDIQRSALMAADLALLPCGPSAVEAWAVKASVELAHDARRVRRGRLRVAAVITKRKTNTDIGKGAREVLTATGVEVLASELGDRVSYQEAPAAGVGVAQYLPTSDGADEVRALTDEVLAHLGVNHGKKARHRRPQATRRSS